MDKFRSAGRLLQFWREKSYCEIYPADPTTAFDSDLRIKC
jgi:hypothetical protein